MTLSPPNIIGVLSSFSTSVRLQGQFTGGTVFVYQNGDLAHPIAKCPVLEPDEVYDFFPGVTLNPFDKITAAQAFGGETSTPSPVPTLVQKVIPPYVGQRFVSHIYHCGTVLFLAGVVSGAEVQLNDGPQFIGKAKSADGGATVYLNSAIGGSATITARQLVGGALGPAVDSPKADQPPPLINFFAEDPMECKPGFTVHGIIDGATVKITQREGDPGSVISYQVPVPNLPLFLPAMTAGQKIVVSEVMENCEMQSFENHYIVQPARVDRPEIDGPFCVGAIKIPVKKTTMGAVVTASQDGVEIGRLTSPGGDMDLTVTPLKQSSGADHQLIVAQTLCSAHAESYPADVTAPPVTVAPCVLRPTLYECVMTLFLENVHPGAYLCAFAEETGPLSQWKPFHDKEGPFTLDTALKAGHHVYVAQMVCSDPPQESNHLPVESLPDLRPPVIVTPAYLDEPYAVVKDLVPGTTVDLYTTEMGYINTATADKDGIAYLQKSGSSRTVLPGNHMHARQRLCDRITDFGPDAVLVDRTPLMPLITAPANNATGVDQRPTLHWSDPGAGTYRQASSFLVELTRPTNPMFNPPLIVNQVVNTGSYALPADLPFSEKFIWRVSGVVGSPGWEARGPAAQAAFTVKAPPPPPPPPPPPVQQGFAKVSFYNCSTEHRTVKLYKRDVTAGGAFQYVQDIADQYDVNGTCPGAGEDPVEITLTNGHVFEIVAVDPDNIGCNAGDPEELACRRYDLVILGKTGGPDHPPIYIP